MSYQGEYRPPSWHLEAGKVCVDQRYGGTFQRERDCTDLGRLSRVFAPAGTVRVGWEQHSVLPELCHLKPLFRAHSR